MRPPVFVVMGTTGEYSDRSEWPVCWFDTEAGAQDYAVSLKAEGDALPAKPPFYGSKGQFNHPNDPDYVRDYTGTDYYVMTVRGIP